MGLKKWIRHKKRIREGKKIFKRINHEAYLLSIAIPKGVAIRVKTTAYERMLLVEYCCVGKRLFIPYIQTKQDEYGRYYMCFATPWGNARLYTDRG